MSGQDDGVTLVAPGVWRTDCPVWGYYLVGSRDALISAGLAQADWLQDGTERDKRGRAVRSKRQIVNGRRISTTMHNDKRQTYTVDVGFTEAELAARENLEAAAEMQRQIDIMPKSAEAYRKSTIDMLDRFTAAVIGVASDTSFDGYRLHPETISELQRLAGHMVNAIEIGEVIFDRKARMATEIKIRVKAAKADPALQGFMQRMTGEAAAG